MKYIFILFSFVMIVGALSAQSLDDLYKKGWKMPETFSVKKVNMHLVKMIMLLRCLIIVRQLSRTILRLK